MSLISGEVWVRDVMWLGADSVSTLNVLIRDLNLTLERPDSFKTGLKTFVFKGALNIISFFLSCFIVLLV